jgi:hypothetical protein
VPLTRRCVEGVRWDWHCPAPAYERRDSGYATCDSRSSYSDAHWVDAAESERGNWSGSGNWKRKRGGWYVASVALPVALPGTKTWLPTFNSCLVSRFYALELELAVHTPGAGVPATNISLKVPVQIASVAREGRRAEFMREGLDGEVEEVPSFESVLRMRAPMAGRGQVEGRGQAESIRLALIEAEVDAQLLDQGVLRGF